jgi:tight adherence protein C
LKTDQVFLTALLGAAAMLLGGLAITMVLRGLAARTLERRVTAIALSRSTARADVDTSTLGSVRRLFYWVGDTIRGRTSFYSEKDLAALESMIASAGFQPRALLPVLLGIKVVAVVAVPMAAFLYGEAAGLTGQQTLLMSLFAIPFGMLGPDWIIGIARRPFLAALRRGVPDALDLLVVCSEAGMGLESALEHVSREMRHSNAAMSLALSRLLDDMRILPDRREAFRNFADGTGVQGARRVATMLSQSTKYGTPLSQALRSVANDLRRERMIALEAKAAKLPVMLTLPLIVFIMPSLFIVLIGPAVLRLGDTMAHIGH